MFKKGYLMDNIQLFAVGVMIGLALFVGIGNTILMITVEEDAWLVILITMVIGTIPIYLITKIMNYKKSLNIFEKIDVLFNKWFAFIFKFLLFGIIFSLLMFNTWTISMFAQSKYLNETPQIFLALLFVATAYYGAKKGLETISRTSLIVLYMCIVCFSIVIFSLVKSVELTNLQPILANGFEPVIIGVLKLVSYTFVPFLTLLIIPKNRIKNNHKTTKAIIYGYLFIVGVMFMVVFLNISCFGIDIVKMYRYPEYFLLRRVSLGNVFSNVENVFSAIWTFNIFISIVMSLYFCSKYVENIIKKDDQKTNNIILLIFSFIAVTFVTKLFKSDTVMVIFMLKYFPYVYGLTSFVIILIILIKTLLAKKIK